MQRPRIRSDPAVEYVAVSRPHSSFRFVVSDLLRQPGQRRAETVSARVDWGVELSRLVPDESLHAPLTMEGASGGVFVRGMVSAVAEHTCHRCTATWREPVEVLLTEMIGVGDGSDYPLDGNVADLESPSCLGLCARCGADLNTGACPGHEDESTSPFAGLRELLEP